MTVVLAHGAGSSGSAARTLLGLESRHDVVAVEDRTGSVAAVCDLIDTAARAAGHVSQVIGVSLGAHAAIRWATGRRDAPRLVCVLPAWTGSPLGESAPTAAAARQIGEHGIAHVLASLRASAPYDGIVDLLSIAWAQYADDELRACLATAARGSGPTRDELAGVTAGSSVVGWYGDAFHPDATARQWARCLPVSRIAMAATPRIHLLRHALATSILPAPADPR